MFVYPDEPFRKTWVSDVPFVFCFFAGTTSYALCDLHDLGILKHHPKFRGIVPSFIMFNEYVCRKQVVGSIKPFISPLQRKLFFSCV